MALAALDKEQVKTIVTEIVTEMWKEQQNVASATPSPDGNDRKLKLSENDMPVASSPSPDENRKFELLERIIRVEEELKHLRKEMQQSREDTNRRFAEQMEYMDRRFAEQREDTKQLREEIKQQREDTDRRFAELREDMNRQLKIVLWVVSGWGGLIGLLVTANTLYS